MPQDGSSSTSTNLIGMDSLTTEGSLSVCRRSGDKRSFAVAYRYLFKSLRCADSLSRSSVAAELYQSLARPAYLSSIVNIWGPRECDSSGRWRVSSLYSLLSARYKASFGARYHDSIGEGTSKKLFVDRA